MKRLLLALPLAACGALPVETVDDAPLDVLRALPPGVAPSDLRLQGGCYYYDDDGDLRPLTTREIEGTQVVDKQKCL
jgi:hypothetical protein